MKGLVKKIVQYMINMLLLSHSILEPLPVERCIYQVCKIALMYVFAMDDFLLLNDLLRLVMVVI